MSCNCNCNNPWCWLDCLLSCRSRFVCNRHDAFITQGEVAMSNPLNDALPARVRQIAYAVLFVVALGFAAYQASEGDWVVFVGSLVTSLLGALAASNVTE